MDLIASTRTLVIGAGPTGQAVVRHLQRLGHRFEVQDTRDTSDLRAAFDTACPGVPVHFGPLDPVYLDQFDEIVVSPGVSPETEGLAPSAERQISDIQLFRRAWPDHLPIVAITGSNAKSTVTTLVGQMIEASGRTACVGGNLGPQALDLLVDIPDDAVAVLELSSFQLARTRALKATVATCLNMSPDHLDWHGSMIEYHKAKHRIFEGVGAIVVNAEDPLSSPLVPDQTPRVQFSVQAPDFHRFGVLVHGDRDWIALGMDPWIPVDELPYQGRHMLQNVMAACAIAHLLGIDASACRVAATQFKGLPHRMAECQTVHGVRFVNDSKGTNVGASQTAMESIGQAGRLFLLAGGDSKGADLMQWGQAARRNCAGVFAFGRDARRFQAAVGDLARTFETLDQAFQAAVAEAEAGDVILLSPAAASFDQFANYQARGRHFEALVEALYEV